MAQYEMPQALKEVVGAWQCYKEEDGSIKIHKICIRFGDDRVWVTASIDEDGEPILKFSSFNLKKPGRLTEW